MLALGLLLISCDGGGSTNSSADQSVRDDISNAQGTYMFGGGSASGAFAAGQAGPTIKIASTKAYPGTSVFSFTGMASAGGTLTVTEAYNHALGEAGDVMPDTLPVVTGTSNNPMLYFSFDNGGAGAISVAGASLTFTADASSIFATFLSADVSCEFDLFDASTQQWSPGGMVELSQDSTAFTISDVTSATSLRFGPGQRIGAIVCD